MLQATAQSKANVVHEALISHREEYIKTIGKPRDGQAEFLERTPAHRVNKLKAYLRNLIIKYNLDPRPFKTNYLTSEYERILEMIEFHHA